MPAPKRGPRFGGSPSHQRLMMANMAAHLFAAEGMVTTVAKAKMLRPVAERLITKAKKGGLHEKRQVMAVITDRDIAAKLFSDIAPRYAERNGGYLRILKLGPRPGDGAPMARIELV
jgi:large subunit ribosomal protein L17